MDSDNAEWCGERAVCCRQIPSSPPSVVCNPPACLMTASIAAMQLSVCLRPRGAVVAQARREPPAKAKGRPVNIKAAPKGVKNKKDKGVDSSTGQKVSRWQRWPYTQPHSIQYSSACF